MYVYICIYIYVCVNDSNKTLTKRLAHMPWLAISASVNVTVATLALADLALTNSLSASVASGSLVWASVALAFVA